MFQWWQADSEAFPIETRYAQVRGKEIAHRFHVTDYHTLSCEMTLTARAHLFSGIDQLSRIEREAVAEIWDQVKSQRPLVKLFNDPRRVLTRFEVLQRLHTEGLNTFRVFRVDHADQVDRFPVFVRSDKNHDGALTGLIRSADALRKSIRALRARGADMNDLMIVEYVDARADDGLYRKYAAFRVGDHVLPSHVLGHHHWMVKSEGGERNLRLARDEEQFNANGRYNDWILRAFKLAGIDYGRLDFGVVAGVPQAWEINMQPTVGRGPSKTKPHPQDEITHVLAAVRAAFHVRLREAFVSLDDRNIPEPEPLVVRISHPVIAALTAERRSVDRRARLKSVLSNTFHSPTLGRPLRWMYRQLLPRG
ncbi:MAG: hypothetical protein ABJB74_17370 [Gemmatimonas sp.]